VTPARALALVTPAPPEASGVADYSWALAHALARSVGVDVVVADAGVAGRPRSDDVGLIDVAEFLSRDAVAPYRDVVYCLGNSPFHTFELDLMAHRRGAVLAHEARFTDLLWARAQTPERGAEWYRQLVHREYPDPPGSDFEPGSGVEAAVRHGVYLFGPVIDPANKVVTTSEFSATVGRRERPDRATDIVNVGFGHVLQPRQTAADPGAFRIGTVGRQNPTKGLDLLLEALAIVRDSRPDATLEVIGLVEPQYLDSTRRRVVDLGIEAAVAFSGWLDEVEYWRRIERVDLAVQLRLSSNGEVSGAVADCLGRGVPTAVSAVGSLAEYPDGVVARIPPGCSARGVAAIIIGLIDDPQRRAAMADAALDHARSHGFDRAAAALLAALG
jgi:glycosyltransferase involved in cell wall biosynthesis